MKTLFILILSIGYSLFQGFESQQYGRIQEMIISKKLVGISYFKGEQLLTDNYEIKKIKGESYFDYYSKKIFLEPDSSAHFKGDFIDFAGKNISRPIKPMASSEIAIIVIIVDSTGGILNFGLMKKTRNEEINSQIFSVLETLGNHQFDVAELNDQPVGSLCKIQIDFSDYRFGK